MQAIALCHFLQTNSGRLIMTQQTVFLDRDGVINRKLQEGCYVTRWDELELLPGVAAAIGRLKQAGMLVVVVTNQRGVARNRCTLEQIETLHQQLNNELGKTGAQIDGFFVCPHEKGACNCRKPLPGLYEQAVLAFPAINAANSVMIGDALSDIEFGSRLGMKTLCVRPGEHPSPEAEAAAKVADLVADSLSDAVEQLLAQL